MATITLSLLDGFKAELKHFSWVNWSSVAKEELTKKRIFERYMKTGTISDEEWVFCERIDWHPVDELPLREEFVKRLEDAEKGPFKTTNRLDFWRE